MTFQILGIVIPTDFHIFRGLGIPPTRYIYNWDESISIYSYMDIKYWIPVYYWTFLFFFKSSMFPEQSKTNYVHNFAQTNWPAPQGPSDLGKFHK